MPTTPTRLADALRELTDIPDTYTQYGPEAAEIMWKQHRTITQLEREIERLRTKSEVLTIRLHQAHAETEALQDGLLAVQNLIDQSQGVYGLHLNGDPAPWGDLLEGGRYEDWLVDFSSALRGEGEK